MPIGILVNTAAIILGGLLGHWGGKHMRADLKRALEMVFGLCAMLMGITSVILVQNMSAVILSVILGTALGITVHLGDFIRDGARHMERMISRVTKAKTSSDAAQTASLVTLIVLFCASGTGIYGSLVEGMRNEHTILIAKSILDLFTAAIFAASLGSIVSAIAVPQLGVFLVLFALAKVIYPMTTPVMIDDFKACGGVLLLATSLRMMQLRDFPTADMIPAMILVMPVSWGWTTWIAPLLAQM